MNSEDKWLTFWIVTALIIIVAIIIAYSSSRYTQPALRSVRRPASPALQGELRNARVAVDNAAGRVTPRRLDGGSIAVSDSVDRAAGNKR